MVYTRCTLHVTEQEKLFCVDHRILVCNICKSEYHSRCMVLTIADASNDVFSSEVITKTTRNIHKLMSNCATVISEREWDMEQLDRKKAEITNTIQQIRSKLVEKVEYLFKTAINNLDRVYATEMMEMRQHKTKLTETIRDLNAMISNVNSLTQTIDNESAFIAVQRAIDKQRKAARNLEHIHDEAHKVVMKFIPNKSVDNALKAFTTIGDIDVDTVVYNVLPKAPRPTKNRELAELNGFQMRKHISARKATRCGIIPLNEKEDTERCCITGIVILKDSTSILADNGNSKIKLMSSERQLIASINLQAQPFDVTAINQTEIACSLPDVKEIQMLEINRERELKLGSSIKTEFDCSGLTFHKERFIVTSISEKAVQALDKQGVLHWTLKTNDIGKQLFEWPWYVTYDHDMGLFYVTDRQNGTITSITVNGELRRVRLVKDHGPRGIVVDNVGFLHICHYMRDTIEIVSTEGQGDRKTLLSRYDGIGHPQAIAYDEAKGQLVVSSWNSNDISVFQMN